VSPETDALQALTRIRESGDANLLVTERNHLLGTVSPRDIMSFLAAKLDLEGQPQQLLPARR
jgi:hypothetical protein